MKRGAPLSGLVLATGVLLLLATEGHMSGKRMPVTFPNLVHGSDGILEVRKRAPFISEEGIPLGTKSGKSFQGYAFAFDVISMVKVDEGLDIPKADSLPVFLIFVKHSADLKRYFFTATDAYEGVDKVDRIRALLKERETE